MKNEINGLAFFDLDGTLLNEHSQITSEISEAMAAMRKNGVIPIIATGRTNLEINQFMEQIGSQSCITMNGQYVLFEGNEIYRSEIDPEICQKMYTKTQSLGQEIGFYNHQAIRVSNHTDMVQHCYDFIHSPVPEIDAAFFTKEPINMLLVIGDDQDEQYHELCPDLTYFRNGPFSIDVICNGGSKGKGVRELVAALQLEDVPTYGFGDGPNDMDLLKACDHRIAMGNATNELKEIATYVTETNTNGGIVQALRHFHLI